MREINSQQGIPLFSSDSLRCVSLRSLTEVKEKGSLIRVSVKTDDLSLESFGEDLVSAKDNFRQALVDHARASDKRGKDMTNWIQSMVYASQISEAIPKDSRIDAYRWSGEVDLLLEFDELNIDQKSISYAPRG